MESKACRSPCADEMQVSDSSCLWVQILDLKHRRKLLYPAKC